MVAQLVRLRLTLLGNLLKRSAWQIVGFAFAALYGATVLLTLVAGLFALSIDDPATAQTVVVAGGSVAVLGWWLLPLVLLTGILPFAFWVVIYRRDATPGISWLRSAKWGLGYWFYMYQNYICVVRALIRLVRGNENWSKTRRNAEVGSTGLVARET